MKPIYIILYAVFVTLILTLVLPRVRELGPRARRAMWILLGVGVVALLAALFVLTR